MTRRARPVLVFLLLTLVPAAAHAQDPAAPSRDPLWNGMVLGASLGALLGAFVGTAAVDCQECAGYNVTATFAAIGAGAGLGLGAGVDAMRGRTTRGLGRARVQLTPVVTKGTRAIVGRIRF